MKTEHKLMWVFMLLMWFSTSCAVAQPALMDGQVVAMQTGSALEIFRAAITGAHGARLFSMAIPGGYGYMAVQPYQGWFGVVLYSTSAKCNGECLREMLRLTGNAMTPGTLKELVAHAERVGFQYMAPLSVPAWMKMGVDLARETLNSAATRMATGWMFVIPAGAFGEPDEMRVTVDN